MPASIVSRVPLWIIGFAAVVIGFAAQRARAEGTIDGRPNILLILADDLGYSDLGCYGGEIRTPHLDSLAARGLRFTQCYNSSRCCPSRASLLTGLYPHQAGIGRFVGKGALPGYQGQLTDHCVTLAEVLEPAGYATYACGKWHVNEPGPIDRGFREFYGFIHGYAVDSWDPSMMIRLPEGNETPAPPKDNYYATDAITDHALGFLDTARKTGRPWLLYAAYQAPHFPVQAPPAVSKQYDTIYRRGWDALRAERLDRMKKLGLADQDLSLPPRGPIDDLKVAKAHGSLTDDGNNPAWDSLSEERRADLARRMAVYAAMIECMDSNIGRLIKSLRDHGELDNTLVIFLSDNGACAEWDPFGFDLNPGKFKRHAPGHGINGFTPPAPNHLHTGGQLAAMGGPGSLFSYGSAWANLSNTPLSLYKHHAFEGGIRTPMIVHWPARVSDSGSLRSQTTHVMDLMATFIEVSGARYPKEHDGHPVLPVEGRSLLPAIDNQAVPPRTLLFEHERNIALRHGDWKLVGSRAIGRDGIRADAKWQLYDLSKDPAEQHDRAAAEPETTAKLTRIILKEARRTLVLPAP